MARVEARLMDLAPPPTVSLGVAPGRGPGDFRPAIRGEPGAEPVVAELLEKAHGEADVAIIAPYAGPVPYVEPFAGTPAWANGKRRPLEPGVAVSPSKPWVGTVTGLFRRKD